MSSTDPADDLLPRATLETLGRFAAAMAHEINNPLGALVMNAEVAAMLLERGRTAELPAVLRQIQSDAMRCAAEVRGMAEVAAPARDTAAPFALGDALAAVHKRLSVRPGRSEESLQLDVAPRLPALTGNRNAIEYAFDQLARRVFASGAKRVRIVAALDGGGAIRVGVRADDDAPATAGSAPARVTRAAEQDAAIDITRCVLAGSGALLDIKGEAGRPVFDVRFTREDGPETPRAPA